MTDLALEQPDELQIEYPAALPVLPLKEMVVFPQSMTPLAIGQERSVRLIDDVVAGERLLVLVASRDSSLDSPGWDDVYDVGTVALVHKMIKVPDGTLRILVQGLDRVQLEKRLDTEPYLLGEFSELPDVLERRRRSKRSRATCRGCSRGSSGSRRTCPRSCSSPRRTSTTRARSAISSPRRSARSRRRSGRRSSKR